MADDMGERTEQPTSRKLSQARNKGQVPKSQDLSAAVTLASAVLIIVVASGFIGRSFMAMLRFVYDSNGAGWSGRVETVWPMIQEASMRGGRVLFPLLLAAAFFAALAQYLQVGWLLTLKPLEPKLSKVNPIAGLKRLFSKRSAVKSGVNMLKLVVVMGVAVGVIWVRVEQIIGLPALSAIQCIMLIGQMLLILAIWLVAVLLVLAIIDWIYQKWQHREDLKMTKQEVKDERRSMEGDPQLRGRRLRMMHDLATQQIQQQVPTADVVVTNPTHFAVALKYDSDEMHAPRVIAKGADFMAQRIRVVAAGAGVPIVERPPLARGLYFGVDVGQEIAPQYYEAVAEILAYVYRLEHETSTGKRQGAWRDHRADRRRRTRVGEAL